MNLRRMTMFNRYVGWEGDNYHVVMTGAEWHENSFGLVSAEHCVLANDLEHASIVPEAECYSLPFIERLKTAILYRARIAWQRS